MTKFPSDKELKEMREKLANGIASKPLSKNAGPVERVKHRLCEKFVIYKNQNKMTQRALAQKIGIDEALMSKILHYHFDEFTTDRLISYLSSLYPDMNLNIDLNS